MSAGKGVWKMLCAASVDLLCCADVLAHFLGYIAKLGGTSTDLRAGKTLNQTHSCAETSTPCAFT